MIERPSSPRRRLLGALSGLCLMLCAVTQGAVAAEAIGLRLPEGKLPLIDPSLLSPERLAQDSDGAGALSFLNLTMQYRFGVLLGEPVMAFRGRYALGDRAVVKVTEQCREFFAETPTEGIGSARDPFMSVTRAGRFTEGFLDGRLLSRSLFSVNVVPKQRILIEDRSLDTLGMHVRFRPDSMVAAPDPYGPAVNGSPDWDAILRRADGSFHDARTARRVFEVGFGIENLQLLEAGFDMRALAREVRAACREGLARKAEEGREETRRASPLDADALEATLDSAFRGDASASPTYGRKGSSEPMASETAAVASIEEALSSVGQRLATREKVAQLRRSSEQFLGLVETDATSVLILASDHGAEDGDEVAILLNDRSVEQFTLTKEVRRIELPLDVGDNVIEVKALNQGSSGKNTALFRVTTGAGDELARKRWELSTGGNAKLLVIRI